MAIIYKITNNLNGKIYIGKSKYNNKDYFGSGLKIGYAIAKYGIDNFSKEILAECDDNIADELETFWIEKLDARNDKIGYNIAGGGQGGDHYWKVMSLEEKEIHRQKIRKGVKGRARRPHSEKTKKKMSLNQNQTPEIKEKRAAAKRNEYIIVDHIEKRVYSTKNIKQFCSENPVPNFGKLRHNERNKKTLCEGRWSCRLKNEYTMDNVISYIEQEVIENTKRYKQQMIESRRKNA